MNFKIIQIVGARPQFIKYLPVSKAIQKLRANGGKIEDILIHTGQHYDHAMSKIFFEQLNIPEPSINLGIGSASHGAQTGRMLTRIEDVLLKMKPDRVVVYGDTNSTLAGALAASKLHIPVAHVEAGLRSFNRKMPEEINRVVTDHLSDLLFCPTNMSVENLAKEGIEKGVHHVGDVMYDALLHYVSKAEKQSDISDKLGLQRSGYLLLTLHRPANTDSSETLDKIMSAIARLTHHEFVFPVHPRTRKAILQSKVKFPKNVQVIDPVGYLDILALEKNAAMILTDSGGLQKEAYLQKVPCVTLREETEWQETVEAGWNILVGSDTDRIVHAVRTFKPKSVWYPAFGDGRAAEHIMDLLTSSFSRRDPCTIPSHSFL
jgi:UDP-N-acetylglucosamine 2-epimerase